MEKKADKELLESLKTQEKYFDLLSKEMKEMWDIRLTENEINELETNYYGHKNK